MLLPRTFYTPQQVKRGELLAAKAQGLDLFRLMERAGQAVFTVALAQYPGSHHWLVCCGSGNNGGDGYIVARLAQSVGIQVTLWQYGDPERLQGDARTAYYHWIDSGGEVFPCAETLPDGVDVVIDGLLGTGVKGVVRSAMQNVIETINGSDIPVVAIDIPSGLCSQTGTVLGSAIYAQHTISLIGLKQGLVTGKARDHVGQLHFAGLGVEETFNSQNTATLTAIDSKAAQKALPLRKRTAHKGQHGKVLLIGGNSGMGGAAILAAQACVRTGSGLTAALVQSDNTKPLLVSCPEVMTADWADKAVFDHRLNWCSVLAIGPGLGRDMIAQQLMACVQSINKPKVMDADALYFLAQSACYDEQRIITPHPAEAARMLDCDVENIEADRFQAVKALQQKYGGVVVLKGAGTLVCNGQDVYVCLAGNPGMASGGMGDVLTGIIVSLLAQGLSLFDAAKVGVLIHSQAADQNAEEFGERGLLASDLIPHLRRLVNR
ncbi:NAD(P)H-hydrate dehydratase [Vibrio cincinnatiensis]|uniref:NAD(P)H-hydrate dehydratase n=1 Tax=Vibrio cincinnatiensis TaxID=675 RepID=UPI001EDFEE7A|nr:NAD(P)H-hydrate dehydratase [Vibrio cincinnatiensis]